MHRHFQLHRLSDGSVYDFDRAAKEDGSVGYKRRDENLWIVLKPGLGWVAIDDATGVITGRPWDTPPEAQSDRPPEGDWVSRKDAKSYVYELKHLS